MVSDSGSLACPFRCNPPRRSTYHNTTSRAAAWLIVQVLALGMERWRKRSSSAQPNINYLQHADRQRICGGFCWTQRWFRIDPPDDALAVLRDAAQHLRQMLGVKRLPSRDRRIELAPVSQHRPTSSISRGAIRRRSPGNAITPMRSSFSPSASTQKKPRHAHAPLRGQVEEKDRRETKKAGRGAGPFSRHSAWTQTSYWRPGFRWGRTAKCPDLSG